MIRNRMHLHDQPDQQISWTTKLMEAPKWEFVNLERPAQERDATYRNTVRQNSVRAFQRNERLERVEKFQRAKACDHSSYHGRQPHVVAHIPWAECTALPGIQPSSAPVVLTQAEATLSSRSLTQAHTALGSEVRNSETKKNYYDKLWALASLDPYGMGLIGFDRYQHYLVNHCKLQTELFHPNSSIKISVLTVMSPEPFQFKPRKEDSPIGTSWMHQVLQDRILLEATLFNASAHLDGIYKRQASPVTLRHRGEIIRTVNKTLETPEQTSDSAIGAIVLIA